MVRNDSFKVFLFKSNFIFQEGKIFLSLCSDRRCNLSASESDVIFAFAEQAFKNDSQTLPENSCRLFYVIQQDIV